jgi:arsenate reductase-like glutaredoxin family protein
MYNGSIKWINFMKQDMSNEEFIDWCELITDFQKSIPDKDHRYQF